MKNKYSLTIKQAKYLSSIIFIGIIFKIITVKDINYKNGIIEKIDGIEFKNKEIILLRNIYDVNINKTNIIIEEKKYISLYWEKYIEALEKLDNIFN